MSLAMQFLAYQESFLFAIASKTLNKSDRFVKLFSKKSERERAREKAEKKKNTTQMHFSISYKKNVV